MSEWTPDRIDKLTVLWTQGLSCSQITARGAPKIGPHSVRHMDRYKYQCAMFCEGQEGATGYVCGAPTDGASAWCDSCVKLVYRPSPEKARAA